MTTALRSLFIIATIPLLLAGCGPRQSSGVVGMPPDLYSSRHSFGSREGALEAFRNPSPRDVERASPAAGRMMEDMTHQEKKELIDTYQHIGPEHQAEARKDPEKAIRYYNRNIAPPLQVGDLPPQEQKEMLERYQNLPPEVQKDLQKSSEDHIR